MLLKTRLIGLVSAFALVASAGATTTKIAAFLPAGDGEYCNPQVDGTGTIKFNASTNNFTRVHLEISDLEPNTQYGIAVVGTVISTCLPYPVTTNPAGHMVVISDTDLPEGIDYSVGTVITVFVWDANAASPFPEDPTDIPAALKRAESVLR